MYIDQFLKEHEKSWDKTKILKYRKAISAQIT